MSGQDTYEDGDIILAFEPHADPVPAHERERRLVDPGFGRVFTDHMAVIDPQSKAFPVLLGTLAP